MSISFEWDEVKNAENQRKHEVSFEEAQLAFIDPHRIIKDDTDHSSKELRFFCLGMTDKGVMTVRFTYRNHRIRIFGAGYWRKGKKEYEQENN